MINRESILIAHTTFYSLILICWMADMRNWTILQHNCIVSYVRVCVCALDLEELEANPVPIAPTSISDTWIVSIEAPKFGERAGTKSWITVLAGGILCYPGSCGGKRGVDVAARGERVQYTVWFHTVLVYVKCFSCDRLWSVFRVIVLYLFNFFTILYIQVLVIGDVYYITRKSYIYWDLVCSFLVAVLMLLYYDSYIEDLLLVTSLKYYSAGTICEWFAVELMPITVL